MSASYDVVGLGNALMDALVVVPDDDEIASLGAPRGTMQLVEHAKWLKLQETLEHYGVVLESGGSCANTIATVGRLGGRAVFGGHVGDDDMGRLYGRKLAEACGGHALTFDATWPTGKCLSVISKTDAERTMFTDLGASTQLGDLAEIDAPLGSCKIAHFTGYPMLDPAMSKAVLKSMERAKQAGARVSIDVADPFVVQAIREPLWDAIGAHASIVFLNADEAEALVGHRDAEVASEHIASEGNVDTVVVKRGAEGSVVWHDGAKHRIDVVRVDAVDTTGAGDAYAGGFLWGVTQGWDAERCGRLGSAVAAQTVSQMGAVVKDDQVLKRVAAAVAP